MNHVCLMGRLTKDVELRYTAGNNTAVAGVTLAVDRQFKKEGQPEADFFPLVIWDKAAEAFSKFLEKGRRVAVVGRLQTRTWDDTEGKKHYVTEVVVESWYFADDKKKDGTGLQQEQPPKQDNTPPPQQNQTNGNPPAGNPPASEKPPWM